jgi:hypothetical protein
MVTQHSLRSRSLLPAAVALALTIGLGAGAELAVASSDGRPGAPVPEVTWKRLEFQASKLLVKARAHVELTQHDSAAVQGRLLERVADHPLPPRGSRVLAIEVGSSFMGRHSTTSLLVDPTDNSALQREQVETGKRQRVKLYRFCADGVYSRRVTPRDDAEKALAPAAWTKMLEEHLDYAAGKAVSDPAALFYLLSIAEPKAYLDGQTVQLFSQGEVHAVEVRFAGEEELAVSYEIHPSPEPSMGDTAAPGTERVAQRVRALRYTLHPADPTDALELLGLEGDLEIWIETERRIPVLVTGKVSPVGRVAVKLQHAWRAR